MSTETTEKLNAWTREIIEWHFNPETGCKFWLTFAEKLSWDPRKEIQGFADLHKFGFFEDNWLRSGDIRDWLPKGNVGKPMYVFETGGSTGQPKTRLSSEDLRTDYSEFSKTLNDDDFPKGSDWLLLGPTGPRRLRLAIEHLAQVRGGICFCVDMDPRWVVKLIKKKQLAVLEEYKRHIVDQALTILKRHKNIKCLFATPKLLQELCSRVSLKQLGIKGVFCGGTQMDAQFHRFAVEELLEGAAFVPTYGNTLMGLACHKPYTPEDNYDIIYYPPLPRAALQVVNPDNPNEVVPYGELGRVMLTTLTKELFMPNFLERDQAIREPACDKYPWDGVRNVAPFSRMGATVVEGVY